MPEHSRPRIPVVFMLLFVIVVQLLALAITPAISASGSRVFEDPSSTINPIIYMLFILVFTALILLAMRLKRGWILGSFILVSIAASIYFVLIPFMPQPVALILTLAALILLRYYPEWYVIDAFGILVCAGISSLFGVSMEIIPTLILLVMLAIYDAISVYKTHHMVSLAEGVINIKAPLLFIVPTSRDYSFLKDPGPVTKGENVKRGAYFLGLGDAIIPTILVISANWSLHLPSFVGINLPAFGAMLGTYFGFIFLMKTTRDKPQAGLPFLNSGAILGFAVGYMMTSIWLI